MNTIDAKYYIVKKITCWTEDEGNGRDKLIDFIEGLDKENIKLKETIQDLRSEGDEYQKRLDNIDFRAMNIQELVKQIRSKI